MSKRMLAFIAYAVSLTAMAAGAVMLFSMVVGSADRNAVASAQARAKPAVVSKNVSAASKVAEPSKVKRVEATKSKRVAQPKPKPPRIAERRHDYDYSSYDRRYYGNW